MSKLRPYLADIASAIREKKGSSEPINAKDFSNEIRSIQSGGGEGDLVVGIKGTLYSTTNIVSLKFGEGVTEVGGYAFQNCPSLAEIILPSTIVSLGASCFKASVIESIHLPDGLKALNNSVFEFCTLLKKIILPTTITGMGATVFNGCTSLSVVVSLNPTPPTIYPNCFENNAEGRLIYVPNASVDAYKSATNWSVYADSIRPLSELPNE